MSEPCRYVLTAPQVGEPTPARSSALANRRANTEVSAPRLWRTGPVHTQSSLRWRSRDADVHMLKQQWMRPQEQGLGLRDPTSDRHEQRSWVIDWLYLTAMPSPLVERPTCWRMGCQDATLSKDPTQKDLRRIRRLDSSQAFSIKVLSVLCDSPSADQLRHRVFTGCSACYMPHIASNTALPALTSYTCSSRKCVTLLHIHIYTCFTLL